MKKFLHVFFVFLLLLPAFAVRAVPLTQTQAFNTVTLPVSDQSNAKFNKALIKGFNELLIRLTGNTSISTLPAIQHMTKHAQQYVQYYRYLFIAGNDGSSTTSLHLQITFNEKALRTLLEQDNIPIWAQNNRPKTLIQIKIDQDNHVEFLSSTTANKASETVHSLSTQYGLPILLPAMDLQDIQLSQSFSNQNTQQPYKTSPTTNALKEFMYRYRINTLLLGNIIQSKNSHQWKGQWHLSLMQGMYQWSSTGKNSTDLIEKAFKNMINILVNYTQDKDENLQKKIVLLHVFNVADLKTYTEISQYISRFNRIKKVSLENLSQNSVTFKLMLMNNGPNTFIQYLNKNQQLHFLKQKNTPVQARQQDVQNIIPILYYDYGETITPKY